MPIVNMKDLLAHAYTHRYALGAFDLSSLDFLDAIITAAERTRAPVILSLAESHFASFDVELAMPAVERAAQRASIPVAIHLDHGASLDSAVKAIRLGANSVMVDASQCSMSDNLAITRSLVRMAHACGVAVESELGYAPGVEGGDAARHPGEVQYTSAAEARDFVKLTGVDCLAVSIGTVHGRMKGKPKLDWVRLREINAALGIPLAIHGGSGLTDEQFHKLITLGVARINCCTALADAAGESIRAAVKAGARGHAALTAGVREAVAAEVERCLRVFGAAGRAAEVLASCRPWLNVEHVEVYNAPHSEPARLRAMMEEGQRVLAAIPGVREVQAGSVIDQSARYRYCWLIRFSAPEALDSYRHHPAHLAFVERLFRPMATDRMSADYQVADARTGVAALPDAASLAQTDGLAA